MDAQEFIEKFNRTFLQEYEYMWDEEESQLVLTYNIKSDVFLDCVKIDFCGSSYSIYKEFLYEDGDSQIITLQTMRDEMTFGECLRKLAGQTIQTDFENGMGCPFCCDLVGYFNLPFSWDTMTHMLNCVVEACQQMDSLSIEEIDSSSELYSSYKETQFELFTQLHEIKPHLCDRRVKDSEFNKDHHFDSSYVYVNKANTVLTGVGTETMVQFCGNPINSQYHIYSGLQYFIIRSKDIIAMANSQLIHEVLELFMSLDEDGDVESYTQYSVDELGRVIMIYGELWAVICPISPTCHEVSFTYEKNRIKKLEHDFIQIAPPDLWDRTYDFSVLSDERFESLCRDLLHAMQFRNIRVRGKTHAPDGGVDITADEEYQTLVGSEKRAWIFQCKHTKDQINRKDLSEVRDLLKEFHADCYGLFYSGYFSPSTLNRIDTIRDNDGLLIKAWDYNGLEILLTKYPAVSVKYFGL